MHARGRKRFLLKKPHRDRLHVAATSAVLALLLSPASGATDVTSTWKGSISGNWNQIVDWSNNPNTVFDYPHNGATDIYDVQISDGSIALNVSPTLRSLTVSGGGIVSSQGSSQPGTNIITVNDSIEFNGSFAKVYVPMQVAGDLRFNSASGTSAVSGTITVGGMVTFPSSSPYRLIGGGPALISVLPTGSVLLTQPLTLASAKPTDPFTIGPAGVGRLDNSGFFEQAATAPITVGYLWSLKNQGTMHLNSTVDANYLYSTGILDLQSDAVAITLQTGGSFSGTLDMATGSSITLNGGTMSLSNINLSNSGTINIKSWLDINGPTTIPGVVNFPTNTARIDLNANAAFTGPVTFTDGLIKGPNRLSASNMNFMAGTISGAEVFVTEGGVLNLTTAAVRKLDAGTLAIEGTANWSAGSFSSQTNSTNHSHIQILSTGTLNIPASASVSMTSVPNRGDILDNAGLLNIDHASLTIGEGWNVNNQEGGTIRAVGGTVAVSLTSFTNAGVIDLQASQVPVHYYPSSNSGAIFFNAPTGSLLIDSTSSWTYPQYAGFGTINNAGLISINGGSFSVPGSILNSGTIRVAAGSLTAPFNSAIRMTNSAMIELSDSAVCSLFIAPTQYTVDFNNSATASILVGTSASFSLNGSGAAFSNQGLISADHARSTDLNFKSFNNSGTIRAIASPLNITFNTDAINSGTIDLQSGSKLTIKGGFNLNLAAGSSLLIDDAPTSISGSVMQVSNAGVISVKHTTFASTVSRFTNTGMIQISDATATFSFLNNPGTIQISSGAASFDNQTASSNPGTIDFGAGGAAVFTISGANGLTTIRSQILSAHLTALPSHEEPTVALGYAMAIQIGPKNPWHGVPFYGNSILVMRTFAGDANLDGTVGFADLVAVAQNYGISDGSAYWTSGDFNYDGNVNFADLVAVAQRYGDTIPAAVPGASIEFQSDLAAAFASVPEPGISTFLFGSVFMLTRRHHSRRRRDYFAG